jgi:hypothetical protein
MNTSRTSRSTGAKRDPKRTALTLLFWKHSVMQKFRQHAGNAVRIQLPHRPTPAEISHIAWDDTTFVPPASDTVDFYLAPVRFGDELWCAVTARFNDEPEMRIIPPFLLPGDAIANVPPFLEEC